MSSSMRSFNSFSRNDEGEKHSLCYIYHMIVNTEADIFERLIRPQMGDLAPEAAHSILALAFTSEDTNRMNQLAEKARQGALTEQEEVEMEEYKRAADLLALMHSKARLSLKVNGS